MPTLNISLTAITQLPLMDFIIHITLHMLPFHMLPPTMCQLSMLSHAPTMPELSFHALTEPLPASILPRERLRPTVTQLTSPSHTPMESDHTATDSDTVTPSSTLLTSESAPTILAIKSHAKKRKGPICLIFEINQNGTR